MKALNNKKSNNLEDFYSYYLILKNNILQKMTGLLNWNEKNKFFDLLMLQTLVLWYFQKLGFFNADMDYFINKFKEIKRKKIEKYNNFYDFIINFIYFLHNFGPNNYKVDEIFGTIFNVFPAIFLFDNNWKEFDIKTIRIPDEFFYVEDLDELKKPIESEKSIKSIKSAKKQIYPYPLFNLLDYITQNVNKLDTFFIGNFFEKLITTKSRKKTAAFYTPKNLVKFIVDESIFQYIVAKEPYNLDQSLNNLTKIISNATIEELEGLFFLLKKIKILDPAIGSGNFLDYTIDFLVDIYLKIKNRLEKLNISCNWFRIENLKDFTSKTFINLLEINDIKLFKFIILTHIIIPYNIFGIDIDSLAVNISRSRFLIKLAKLCSNLKEDWTAFPVNFFNLKCGNTLVGALNWNKDIIKKKQTILTQFLKMKEEFKTNIRDGNEYKLHKIFKTLQNITEYFNVQYKFPDLIPNKLIDLENNLEQFYSWIEIFHNLHNLLIKSLYAKYTYEIDGIIKNLREIIHRKVDLIYFRNYVIPYKFAKKLKVFHWEIEFSNVFYNNNGFDIIIGNPPYIRQEEINHIINEFDYKSLLAKIYPIYERTFDLSVYFMLRSLFLLKKFGIHSFIITNKWTRAKYGFKIRNLLKKKTSIIKIIDFSGVKVFKNLTVDTMIYLICNRAPDNNHTFLYSAPTNIDQLDTHGYFINQKELQNGIWNFLDSETNKIKMRMEENSIKLKDLGIKIYYGIKTGFNKAFLISNDIKKRILNKNPESSIFIKPVLRGRDIKRYYFDWKGQWLIVIPTGWTRKNILIHGSSKKEVEKVFAEKFPMIYSHFTQISKNGVKKGKGLFDRDDQGEFWWELRPCFYYEEFKKPKLVWNRITSKVQFQYVPGGFYVLDSTFFMVGEHLKFLLLILQSSLVSFIIRNYCAFLGSGLYAAAQYIEQIPIKIPAQFKTFEIIADYLLFLNLDPDRRRFFSELINFFDKKIADCLVYELYFNTELRKSGINNDLNNKIMGELIPIDYDKYLDLYFKKILNSKSNMNLLFELENQILDNIINTYKKLINNSEIASYIESIKNHQFIRRIESALNY